ncbi:MAG: T9SS type A sorting domain-containing protein [Flavobacteriales bacterium]|nr:T9SS type A sorting domain-containing protein [Flavobacteriales bacterium]
MTSLPTERITLDLNGTTGTVRIELLDAVGRLVLQGRDQGAGYRNMDVSALRTGAYLLRVHAGDRLYHARFIKE